MKQEIVNNSTYLCTLEVIDGVQFFHLMQKGGITVDNLNEFSSNFMEKVNSARPVVIAFESIKLDVSFDLLRRLLTGLSSFRNFLRALNETKTRIITVDTEDKRKSSLMHALTCTIAGRGEGIPRPKRANDLDTAKRLAVSL